MPIHAVVLVLGDSGRSPRMNYHALSLCARADVRRVSLVGYPGEPCKRPQRSHKQADEKLCDERLAEWINMTWPVLLSIPKLGAALHALWRAATIFLAVLWKLYSMEYFDVIFIQNPPALPALLAALIIQSIPTRRASSIIIDWHNLGFAMLQMRHGERHPLVLLSKWMEGFLAQSCKHLCVSKAMSSWLKSNFRLEATVMYDRPHVGFDRSGTAIFDKHALLTKLNFTFEALFKIEPPRGLEVGETTIQTTLTGTYSNPIAKPLLQEQIVPIIVSSTSWTPDEDFHILLNTLIAIEARLKKYEKVNSSKGKGSIKRCLVCITGKGPLKAMFEKRIEMLSAEGRMGTHIAIRTIWLEMEDYPTFLGCADLGVCLHTSTSGLDLPMKVLDMFGSGLPVCAVSFPTLPELVRHNENGLIFTPQYGIEAQVHGSELDSRAQSRDLYCHLLHLIFNVTATDIDHGDNARGNLVIDWNGESGKDTLHRLRKEAANIQSWDDTWPRVVPTVLQQEQSLRGTVRSQIYTCLDLTALLILCVIFLTMRRWMSLDITMQP